MYGLLISFAVIASLLLSEKFVRKKELNSELFWEGSFWAILSGIVGARIYHVIDFWEVYSQNISAIFRVWHGGLGIFGALFFGGIAFVLYLNKKKENIWNWLDVVAIPLPFAQAVGRWGNYFNNELIPYAIYESLADLGLFLVLIILQKKKLISGYLFFIYLIGYSVIRLFLEPLRERSWEIANLNVAQSISILLVLIASLMLWKLKQKNS